MKTYHVITVFPEMIHAITDTGVIGQAQKAEKIKIKTYNPRAVTTDVHKTIDDRPFGGGDGMLMLAEPLALTLSSISQSGFETGPVIYLSPQGAIFDDKKAQEIAKLDSVTLICGRYGGVDQRFLNQHVDEEISIGDYVLSGGEIGAAAIIDASARFVPGVLGHHESASNDSITSGLLEAPQFTRPREWQGASVPEVLLSGNHAHIEEWKLFMGVLKTLQKRPEALKISRFEIKKMKKFEQFVLELSEQEREVLDLSKADFERIQQGIKKW